MSFKFGNVPAATQKPRYVNPIELYTSRRRTDPSVNDLWLAQGDVLRKWHERRNDRDVSITLNTGAGKTYVGLLIGQFLTNETRRNVVYACASIQLVEQTAQRAVGYGLDVTTYSNGAYSNDLYQRGEAILVTTYYTLFNGKSHRFRDGSLEAVIFDDAHTADGIIRDCYTLTIRRDAFPAGYAALTAIISAYFVSIDESASFNEMVAQATSDLKFVPPFFVHQNFSALRERLLALNLSDDAHQMFSWDWVRDRLEVCAWFVSSEAVSITPAYLPVNVSSDFGRDLRRIYLSATLQAPDAFYKTFGVQPGEPIAAETAAGASERFIIFPTQGTNDEEQTDHVAKAIKEYKALILVPSRNLKQRWEEKLGISGSNDAVITQVEDFKKATAATKLVLANRYDGVDLPGDTCRVMILAGLPVGQNVYERYLFERLGLLKSFRSTVSSRLTQSFGRIFRGMSDYGVVLLAGNKLLEWLASPQYRAMLPQLLQRQLAIGRQASAEMNSIADVRVAIGGALARDEDWLHFYNQNIDNAEIEPAPAQDTVIELAKLEHALGLALWRRDLDAATASADNGLPVVIAASTASGSWYALWAGAARMLANDWEGALKLFSRSRGLNQAIPRVLQTQSAMASLSPQFQNLYEAYYHDSMQSRSKTLGELTQLAAALQANADSPRQMEEHLRKLGELLGLESSRPDNEFSTGPDVLWSSADEDYLGIEAKTDKKSAACYQKKDLGQLADHERWLERQHTNRRREVLLVGPTIPACRGCNPDDKIVSVELSNFAELAKTLRDTVESLYQAYTPITFASQLFALFSNRGLIYSDILLGLRRNIVSSSELEDA